MIGYYRGEALPSRLPPSEIRNQMVELEHIWGREGAVLRERTTGRSHERPAFFSNRRPGGITYCVGVTTTASKTLS